MDFVSAHALSVVHDVTFTGAFTNCTLHLSCEHSIRTVGSCMVYAMIGSCKALPNHASVIAVCIVLAGLEIVEQLNCIMPEYINKYTDFLASNSDCTFM